MPPKRKRAFGPLAGGYRSYKSRKMSAAPKRYRKLNKRTAGYLGIEKKFLDTALTSTSLVGPTDSAGGEVDPTTFLGLTSIAQGDGESNRDGRKCVVKSIFVQGQIRTAKQANSTAGDNSCLVYIAMVQDMQTNGAQLNSEDVFTNPAANINTCTAPFRNLEQVSRFKVLAKRTLKIENPNMTYDGTNIEVNGTNTPFSMYVPMNMPIVFKGTTGVIANVSDNSVHMIAYANNLDLAPIIDYNARCRFVG